MDVINDKAHNDGMIFPINYSWVLKQDNNLVGHERVIQPMVLGRSSQGKVLT
jgi:hypothetical protein